jgi:MFS family permease
MGPRTVIRVLPSERDQVVPTGGQGQRFRPLLIVALGWLVVMAGANLAALLYAVFAARFGFSNLELTSVFATYAFVLVPTLILFGRLSDRLGRRPVVVAGMAVVCGHAPAHE